MGWQRRNALLHEAKAHKEVGVHRCIEHAKPSRCVLKGQTRWGLRSGHTRNLFMWDIAFFWNFHTMWNKGNVCHCEGHAIGGCWCTMDGHCIWEHDGCLTLSDLMTKWLSQEWDEVCQQAFGELKSKLSSPPELKFADFYKPFEEHPRVSDFAICGLLM